MIDTEIAEVIDFEATDEADAVEAFRSHRQYIRAFAMLAGFRTPHGGSAYERKVLHSIAEATRASQKPAAQARDVSAIRSSLANAWSTELLLGLTSQLSAEDEFIRITNIWTAIQTYYVAYHATQALCIAKGMARPDSHPKTQKQFISLWVNRSRQIPPWTIGIGSDGEFKNIPSGIAIDPVIHPWSNCNDETCWSLAAKALRTTREAAISKALKNERLTKVSSRRKAWEEDEQQRLAKGKSPRKKPRFPSRANLTVQERQEVENRIRVYSLVDYLYRLRIKSNYEDATMFLDGPEDDISSRQVHDDLRLLASSVLLIHEIEICRVVGRATMQQWIDEWLSGVPMQVESGLPLRKELILR